MPLMRVPMATLTSLLGRLDRGGEGHVRLTALGLQYLSWWAWADMGTRATGPAEVPTQGAAAGAASGSPLARPPGRPPLWPGSLPEEGVPLLGA